MRCMPARTNEFERSTITDLLFGSVTDVLDRYLPDTEKHGALRGMLVAAGRATPPTADPRPPARAAALAYRVRRARRERAAGQEAARRYRRADHASARDVHVRGRRRTAAAHPRSRRSTVADGRVTGVRLEDGTTISAPIVISGIAPDLTVTGLVDAAAVPADIRERFSRVDHRGSYLQMHFALDGIPDFAAPYELLNDPAMQSNIGIFSTPEELQQQWEDCRRGIVPADPAIALQMPSVNDPGLAPAGKHAVSAFSLWFPGGGQRTRATAR